MNAHQLVYALNVLYIFFVCLSCLHCEASQLRQRTERRDSSVASFAKYNNQLCSNFFNLSSFELLQNPTIVWLFYALV